MSTETKTKTEPKEKKKTLQEIVMSKKTTNYFVKRNVKTNTIYFVDPKELIINSDLREIPDNPMNDAEYVRLYESIKFNDFDVTQPIVVMKSTGWIITGNRRTHVAISLNIPKVPVVIKEIGKEDYPSYIRSAYYLNVHKSSKISELAKHINVLKYQGSSAEEISKEFGISQKSVYDVFKITDDRLVKLLEKEKLTLKNALVLMKNKPFRNDEMIKKACKLSEEELKKDISAQRKEQALKATQDTGKGTSNVVSFNNKEQNKMFFIQLANYNKETINTKKLKAFLLGQVKEWTR